MRYKVIFALAAAIVLSSCTKEIEKGVDAPLNFCANVPEIVQVKAEAVTSVTDFYAAGYDGSTQWFPKNEVQISGSSKTFDSFRWKWDVTKTFYAYTNNVPGGATATIASTGVTLTYTSLPTAASAQTDVLLGRYEGNGNGTGTASMTFYHPLAQVVFNVGTIDASLTAISKIEIADVYNAGSTTLSTSTTTTSVAAASGSGSVSVADFSWTGTGGSVTVSQNVSLPASGQIGVPFMLIPQDLANKNVTVKVYATVGGASKTLTATLNTGSFATGKKTVCTLHYSSVTELNCTLMNYLADAEDDIFPKPLNLPGEFSVSDTKKVKFSRGFLFYDGSKFYFEDKQTIIPANERVASHIGSFYFSKNASIAASLSYSDPSGANGDILFTNASQTTPNTSFEVSGVQGEYRVLSESEYDYLLGTNSKRNGKHSYAKINDGSQALDYFIIAPDVCLNNFTFNADKHAYTASEWKEAEAAGLVCIYAPHSYTCYWLPLRTDQGAPDFIRVYYFNNDGYYGNDWDYINLSKPIRLVTDVY